jgi:hypothetical protein
MHVLINVKSPNNISKWQTGFNSVFKGLMGLVSLPSHYFVGPPNLAGISHVLQKLVVVNTQVYQQLHTQWEPINLLSCFLLHWQILTSSNNSNKLTNQMKHFHKFITWRLCVAQHVSGAPHAHHQELTTALATSGFTLERGGSSVVGRGLAGYNRPYHDQQCCYHHVKSKTWRC